MNGCPNVFIKYEHLWVHVYLCTWFKLLHFCWILCCVTAGVTAGATAGATARTTAGMDGQGTSLSVLQPIKTQNNPPACEPSSKPRKRKKGKGARARERAIERAVSKSKEPLSACSRTVFAEQTRQQRARATAPLDRANAGVMVRGTEESTDESTDESTEGRIVENAGEHTEEHIVEHIVEHTEEHIVEQQAEKNPEEQTEEQNKEYTEHTKRGDLPLRAGDHVVTFPSRKFPVSVKLQVQCLVWCKNAQDWGVHFRRNPHKAWLKNLGRTYDTA